MVSVIILQNGTEATQAEEIATSLRGALGNDIRVAKTGEGITLPSLIDQSAESAVIFVDAAAPRDAIDGIRNHLQSVNAVGLNLFSVVGGSNTDRLPEFRPDTMVHAIAYQESWPIAAVYCDVPTLREFGHVHGETAREFFMLLIALGVANAMPIDEIGVPSSSTFDSTARNEERARVLQAIINACNIEDLFPNHAWKLHQEESAAACYHTVAALFIRFNDIEAANQALTLSDNFEDSPRSLALKSLIAQMRGESLGAVANMVASLQQYEMRKFSSEKHYLSFTPTNLERINEELRAGLQALNKQDNSAALAHFSEAVFNFDPFYREWGVSHAN